MVDVTSTDNDRPETRATMAPSDSAFKGYLEQNPEMAAQLIRVLLQLY